MTALETAGDWAAYRERVRRTLQETVGPLAERTPLSARTTGSLCPALAYRAMGLPTSPPYPAPAASWPASPRLLTWSPVIAMA